MPMEKNGRKRGPAPFVSPIWRLSQGVRLTIAHNGDLMVYRAGKPSRHRLAKALTQPAWLDPASKEPRT
jgi:hypothetical protein